MTQRHRVRKLEWLPNDPIAEFQVSSPQAELPLRCSASGGSACAQGSGCFPAVASPACWGRGRVLARDDRDRGSEAERWAQCSFLFFRNRLQNDRTQQVLGLLLIHTGVLISMLVF